MSVLKGFLQPSPMEETKEVIISERFKGEDGNNNFLCLLHRRWL